MKILLTNAEVSTIITNYTEVESAAAIVDEANASNSGKVVDPSVSQRRKDFSNKVLSFLITPESEIITGPVVITKVKNGIGIEVKEDYVIEFMEIYLSSIIPLLKPVNDILIATKVMNQKFAELDQKFSTKK